MTLLITVATPRLIYLSADFQVTDRDTGKPVHLAQKIELVQTKHWTALVCFAGVASTGSVDVGAWLAELVASVPHDDPFQTLLDRLLEADKWLTNVLEKHRRHTFSVAAFVGTIPKLALVSNYESFTSGPAASPRDRLSISKREPIRVETFAYGQPHAVSRAEQRQLAALAARETDPEQMYTALAEVNRKAALSNSTISSQCATAHLRVTGQSGLSFGGVSPRESVGIFPEHAQEMVAQLLAEKFGPGNARLVGVTGTRVEQTDEYHAAQLQENPNSADVRNNYGNYLLKYKQDVVAAEREYEAALTLNPQHVNALVNLANVEQDRSALARAEELYDRALATERDSEVAVRAKAVFLRNTGRAGEARELTQLGLRASPASPRLLLLDGDLALAARDCEGALRSFEQARAAGANAAKVESGFAQALHGSGAPVGECIAAYWVALACAGPDARVKSCLKLNLAQLLLAKGDDGAGDTQLREALALGLEPDAELEARFYQLAHSFGDEGLCFTRIRILVEGGARLAWNVDQNVARVRDSDPQKAERLETLRTIMKGERSLSSLDTISADWFERRDG